MVEGFKLFPFRKILCSGTRSKDLAQPASILDGTYSWPCVFSSKPCQDDSSGKVLVFARTASIRVRAGSLSASRNKYTFTLYV